MKKFLSGIFGHEAWYRVLEFRWHRIRQLKRQAGYDPKIEELVPIVVKGHYQGDIKPSKVPAAIVNELPSHLTSQFGEVQMKGGLKNPAEASRVLSHQIIGFNRNTYLRNYKSQYRQQPRSYVKRPKRQASVKVLEDKAPEHGPLEEAEMEGKPPLNIKIDNS